MNEEKELEKRLSEIYGRAYKETKEKADSYFEKFKEQDKKMLVKLNRGEISKDDYQHWKRNKILAGEKWNSLVDELSNEFSHADETARNEINKTLPSFLAEGMNKALYEGEVIGKLTGNLGLVDKDTAMYIAKNNPELLPSLNPESETARKIRQGKIKRWNQQHITSEITQGVIQGESMSKVSKRLQNVAKMDKNVAMRNARTATGAAINAGKIEGMKRNESMGVPTEKMWRALLDNRTRHSHRELDNQIIPIDEAFVTSEGYKLMYPRDPNGDACMIYNCRCTILSVPTKIKDMVEKLYDREGTVINTYDQDGNIVKAQSYDEWKKDKAKATPKGKKSSNATEPKQAVSDVSPVGGEKLSTAMGKDYEAYSKLIEKSPTGYLYKEHLDDVKAIHWKAENSIYDATNNELFAELGPEGQNKFSTISHEVGHFLDYRQFDKYATYKEIDQINAGILTSDGSDFMRKSVSLSDEFLGAMRKDIALYKQEDMEGIYRKLFSSESDYHNSDGVQDFFAGIFRTRNKYGGYGHANKYYNRDYNLIKKSSFFDEYKENMKKVHPDATSLKKIEEYSRQHRTALETWANLNESITVGGKKAEYMKKYLPNSYEKFLEIVKRNKP